LRVGELRQVKYIQVGLWTLGLTTAISGLALTIAATVTDSLNESGIDALRLHRSPYNLTGRKIALGQLEVGRPGKFGKDKPASGQSTIAVADIFYRNQPARLNRNVDSHAHAVAGVMVSTAKALPGIAPQARLYSAAAGIPRRNGQPEDCLAAQHLALQNSGDVRAINFSFGESLRSDPRTDAKLDGNALLTQCLDWSARVHNVLYLVAGNQGKGGIPIPTDHFNGMTIASSMRVQGQFSKVDFGNISDPEARFTTRIIGKETNAGLRRSVSLIAPGNQVSLWTMDNRLFRSSGTSFAAPHVTATVALLQEFSDRQLRQKLPHWSVDARRHLVMKAVLMNSADKFKDSGNGQMLGMTRTVLTKQNKTWLESDAYRSRQIPLDQQLGAGHLNAFRAYQQFSQGQREPNQSVPSIAWDYRTVDLKANVRDYLIEQPLRQGSQIAVTLTWDRQVDLVDRDGDREYDVGEAFREQGLNNLDLYLMPAAENDSAKSIWSSESQVDSVEHLFHKIPQTGRYKIRVHLRQATATAVSTQPYALAWWSVPTR
jgi:Subtilase family